MLTVLAVGVLGGLGGIVKDQPSSAPIPFTMTAVAAVWGEIRFCILLQSELDDVRLYGAEKVKVNWMMYGCTEEKDGNVNHNFSGLDFFRRQCDKVVRGIILKPALLTRTKSEDGRAIQF